MESIAIGDRFGYWTVTEDAVRKGSPSEGGKGKQHWRCLCDCGRERIVYGYSLITGASTSCGCSKRINSIASIMGRLIVQENGCCTWPGCDNGLGYGVTMFEGKPVYVHRLLYTHFVGPIPEGLVLDHVHCDNPSCANWTHLEPKTDGQNLQRSNKNAQKTHCKNGHPLSGDNLRIEKIRGDYWARICLTCRVTRDHERYARRQAARKALEVTDG